MSCSTSTVVPGASFALDFTSSSMQAAYLVLPDGGKHSKYKFTGILEQYAIDHAHEWYKHFNGRGMQIHNGMLYLVTGCNKCRTWANACYSHTAESGAVSLNLSIAGGGARVGGTLHCKWEVQSDSPVHHRSHPEPPHTDPFYAHSSHAPNLPELTENQTIFLHGYSISVYEKSARKFRLKEKVKLREKPPQDSSIPYSAAAQSSMTPAATETGTAQVSLLFSFYKS